MPLPSTHPQCPIVLPPKITLPGEQSLIMFGENLHLSCPDHRSILIGLNARYGVVERVLDRALKEFLRALEKLESFDQASFRMLSLVDHHFHVPSGEVIFLWQSTLIGVPDAMSRKDILEIANRHIGILGDIKMRTSDSWEDEVYNQMRRTWLGPDFYSKLLGNDLSFLPDLLEGEI